MTVQWDIAVCRRWRAELPPELFSVYSHKSQILKNFKEFTVPNRNFESNSLSLWVHSLLKNYMRSHKFNTRFCILEVIKMELHLIGDDIFSGKIGIDSLHYPMNELLAPSMFCWIERLNNLNFVRIKLEVVVLHET